MIPLGLIPPGIDHVPLQRLRLQPHDGSETPEALARQCPAVHGSMTLADGKTPIRIVTNGTPEDQPTKVHLFTTAPKITVRDRSVIFAGTYPPEIVRPKKSKPPANYIRTPDIAHHLHGWTPLGRMVCTMKGDTATVEANVAQNLMRYPRKTTHPTMLQLCNWPLDPRSMDIMSPDNWASDVPPEHEARLMLLTTVATTAWLQTWGIMMGRFLHQTGALRQTWPLLLRHHELSCRLYQDARVWHSKPGHAGKHLVSEEVERSFPTYVRLNALVPRPIIVSEADIKAHQRDWQTFLVNHSFGDALFAWFYMNANIKAAFDICDGLQRKIHQFWCTRHWIMHDWDTLQATQKNAVRGYSVIQGMKCPLINLPVNRAASNFDVFCISHPVVRPGLPLFAVQTLSLDAFAQNTVLEMYGARVFVEALAVVWDAALCMTVADQRIFFRVLFAPHGGGLFDTLLRSVCKDVSNLPVNARAKPPSALRQQMQRAGKERRRHVGKRNTSLARVIGLPMSRRGPRDAGAVIQLNSAAALEHVSDRKPLSFEGHGALVGTAWAMGCSDAPITLTRNSQSFYAPNHEVDVARFAFYLRNKLQSELYRKRLAEIVRRGRVVDCVNRHPQRKLDLGHAYFTICAHHTDQSLCEYDVWAALLAFNRSGDRAQLPETQEALCAALPAFWLALNAHWHRYQHRVRVEVTQYLMDTLHATSDLNVRRERFQTWQAAEKYASAHRLDTFAADSLESLELSRLIAAFCLSERTPRTTRWMLFFFLTHVQQPVPLDPAYFVKPTAQQDMKLIREVGGPQDFNVSPLVQLQRAVSAALCFSDVLWTSSVEAAWRQYKYSVMKPQPDNARRNAVVSALLCMSEMFSRGVELPLRLLELDKNAREDNPEPEEESMIKLLLQQEPSSSRAFELVLHQFVINRTVAVFARVPTELPTSCDNLGDISDLVLAQWLFEDGQDTPDYTVFLQTETRSDAVVCEFVYRSVFKGVFQFVQTTRTHTEPLRCPGDTTRVWRPALPNWATRAIPLIQ